MHDVPYQRPQERGPETTAIMSKIASDIRSHFSQVRFCWKYKFWRNFQKTIGIQILSCGNKEALSVALAADLDFIRCESFVFGHLGDEGYSNEFKLIEEKIFQSNYIKIKEK